MWFPDPNVPQFIATNRGGQKMLFQGHLYYQSGSVGYEGQRYWQCVQLTTCNGRAITDMDDTVVGWQLHNHAPPFL
ncbi:hypothetical protein GPALN_005278 [Globodera pallida]|nr:hypothetical protein GPALN_005278 [Globodera pallida]